MTHAHSVLKLGYGACIVLVVAICGKALPSISPDLAQFLYGLSAFTVNRVCSLSRTPKNLKVAVIDISGYIQQEGDTEYFNRRKLADLVGKLNTVGVKGIAIDNDFGIKFKPGMDGFALNYIAAYVERMIDNAVHSNDPEYIEVDPPKAIRPSPGDKKGEEERAFFEAIRQSWRRKVPTAIGVYGTVWAPIDDRFYVHSSDDDPELTQVIRDVQAAMFVRGRVETVEGEIQHKGEGCEKPGPEDSHGPSYVTGPNWAPSSIYTLGWSLPTLTHLLTRGNRDSSPMENSLLLEATRSICVAGQPVVERMVDFGSTGTIRSECVACEDESSMDLSKFSGKHVILAAVKSAEPEDKIDVPGFGTVSGGMGQAAVADSLLRGGARELKPSVSYALDLITGFALLFGVAWFYRNDKGHVTKEIAWTFAVILTAIALSAILALFGILWFESAAFVLGHCVGLLLITIGNAVIHRYSPLQDKHAS